MYWIFQIYFAQSGEKSYPVQPQTPSGGNAINKSAPSSQQPTQEDYKSFDIVKATQYGASERVVELIEGGYDVNQPDKENVTILHWAAINNRSDIVKYVHHFIGSL